MAPRRRIQQRREVRPVPGLAAPAPLAETCRTRCCSSAAAAVVVVAQPRRRQPETVAPAERLAVAAAAVVSRITALRPEPAVTARAVKRALFGTSTDLKKEFFEMKRLCIAAAVCVTFVMPVHAARHEVMTNDGRVVYVGYVAKKKVAKRAKVAKVAKSAKRKMYRRRHVTLAGVVEPLRTKAAEIVSNCGSRVVSAVRHTRVIGSGRMSLHATGRAVDLAGNPRCIYAHLRRWRGGYSTDYARVRHVHISWGGREHGIRFVHRNPFLPRRVAYAR